MNKTEVLRVRLTPEEADAFLAQANSLGIKRARLLRKMIREFINQQPDLLESEQNHLRNIVRLLMGLSRMAQQIRTSDKSSTCSHCCQVLVHMQEDFDAFKVLCETYLHDTQQRLVRQE